MVEEIISAIAAEMDVIDEEAQQIIAHAHEFVAQFRNPEREELISLLVLKRYFELTGQWEPSTHP